MRGRAVSRRQVLGFGLLVAALGIAMAASLGLLLRGVSSTCASACAAVVDPTPPPALVRSATAERDAIRLTVTLDENPVNAGGLVAVTTIVQNLGQTPVFWFHDSCDFPVVQARTPATRPGRPLDGIAAAFKERLLVGLGAPDLTSITFGPDASGLATMCDLVLD